MSASQKILYITLAVAIALAAAALAASLTALGSLNSSLGSVNSGLSNLQNRLDDIGSGLKALRAEVELLRSSLAARDRQLAALNKTVDDLLREVKMYQRVASAPVGAVEVRYARLFSVAYDGDVYILTDAMGRRILLVPRGMQQDLAAYYVAKYKPAVVVRYPVERAVYMSSTHVALAYRLYKESGEVGVLRSIAGIMWGREYTWHLKEVADMLGNSSIADVGPAYSPNYEAIAKLRPDVVFVYFYPGPYGTESVVKKLDQLGIPYVVVNEFQEAEALGRAEWIKFIAPFYNLTWVGVRVFNGVESKWRSLASLVADLDRPRVAWFIIYGGVLYPAGPGVRDLIRLAGGRYAYANYSRVDMEVVLKHKNDVDVLVWSGYGVDRVEDLLKIEPRLKELRPVITGRVYAYSPAYYQLANAYPEKVLEELIWIIHPEVAPPGNFTLFRQLR
ncbi:ABC transporter substrate-binding protein [Pyrobaculum sp.]|uniref:ABC transporter substrate-binding protein n=1 Tax=Pyrobaculum sp. TaxID=2004705 RepID=UPI003D131BDA